MKLHYYLLPFSIFAQNITIELNDTYPLTLESSGKYRLIYNDSTNKFEARLSKKAKVEEKNFGLIWGDEINPYQDFTIVPIGDTRLLLNGIQYPGSLHFAYGKKIINHVDVDVIVHVMMQQKHLIHYNKETLKALAIAIRTDLCFDPRAIPQDELSYQGSAILYQYPQIFEAIKETSSEVMTFDNKLFPTTYCVDAGGKSATFGDIFRQNVQAPKGQALPFSSSKTWNKSFKKEEMEQKLNCQGLKNVSFYQDKNTSKVYAIKIEDQKGSRVVLIERFMELFELASNDFALESKNGVFKFSGTGEGLGVGLCLKTAENLAKKGLDAQAILKECYPHIGFQKLDK
jgi:SpoIID/LytB domain protein